MNHSKLREESRSSHLRRSNTDTHDRAFKACMEGRGYQSNESAETETLLPRDMRVLMYRLILLGVALAGFASGCYLGQPGGPRLAISDPHQEKDLPEWLGKHLTDLTG